MDLTTNQETNYNSRFNVVEYAIGNVGNRHIFKTTDDEMQAASGKELYRSHYIFTDEIIEYLKIHRNEKGDSTLAGFDGELTIDELVIDIDDEDLANALENTRKFLRILESNFDLDLKSLRINFSGSKGFHVRFPSHLFGGFVPSIDLHKVGKDIALKLSEGILIIDTSVYDKTRLMRVVNSCNAKSGLYAIPLTSTELFQLSIDEIKALAVKPRSFTYTDPNEFEPVESLVTLKDESCEIDSSEERKKIKIEEAFEPKEPGERHDTLAVLVGKLIDARISDEDI